MSPFLSDTLLRTQSDERLAALAAAGRDRAFEVLVERHRRSLLTFARHAVGPARAEDVVQQALLQAWRALTAGAEVEHVRGWLHQIVRHAAWRAARAAADERLPAGLVGSSGPQDEVERRMEVSAVVASLAAMPERQRAAIVQTVLEGQSQREVAASLGLTEGAVRQLVHRGRTFLRTAATCVIPMPLASWAAAFGNSGSGPIADRIAEGVAGAGSVGAAGLLAKGGIAFVAAGAVATGVATEAVNHHPSRRPASPPAAQSAAAQPAAGGTNGARAPVALRRAATEGIEPEGHPHGSRGDGSGRVHRRGSRGHGSSGNGQRQGTSHGSGPSGSGRSGDDTSEHSTGSGRSGSGDDSTSSSGRSGSDDGSHRSSGGTSGSGTSGDDGTSGSGSSGSGTSGSGSSSDDAAETSSSGPGSGEDHVASVTVPTTTTPDQSDGGGSDDGTSGSGSGGHGSD
jgi:RNA polymerase sigma factor (sigma-70 family)